MNLITTMVSGWYSGFIPLFEYTAKKFNPNCHVKVFYKEGMYPEHNNNTVGLLRFCVPNSHFEEYKYVYFTDVDFIFFPHKVSTVDYHIDILERSREDFAGHRGVVKNKWINEYARMAGGSFLVNQNWLEMTGAIRNEYVNKYINGIPSREHDEIYLQRICSKAGYKIPEKAGYFNNGERYDGKYRNLHLGDFKPEFRRRWMDTKRMCNRFLIDYNYKEYKNLTTNDNYLVKLIYEARRTPEINKIFYNLNYHLERR